jgi:general secretion pathway protein D
VKKIAALLLAIGLMGIQPVHAEEKAPRPPASPADQADVQKARPSEDSITMNFTNVDINALIKVMSELTRRNFILDEHVTGKITIMTPTKISPDEAYQVFLSALEIKGFTAVEDGKVIRIISAASARQSGLRVFQDGETRGGGFVTKLIRLKFVNPQEIVRTLAPLITKDGTVLPYPVTNSIIITDSLYNIRKIESLIRAMDVEAPEGKGKISVYYLKNGSAEEFAKVMTAIVSRIPIPPAGGAVTPTTILEGTVTITADKMTNSLIIVSSADDYKIIKDVIEKLDIRRRQVYVEAAIIEMSLAKQRDLGFEMQVPISQSQFDAGQAVAVGGTNFGGIGNVVAGGPAAFASMNGLAVGAVKGTFRFKGVDYLSVGALLRAVQTDADVNVLSTPNILTTDNQKAEIMVGQNVPFITGQTQNAITGSATLFNTVERKDVGIKLTLTPQITSDDNVRLEINQEISDVVADSNTSNAGPTTSKRSASTTVVVKDRQTMVIGGLIRDNVTSSTMKVPLLGDIPILGWLFKFKTSRVEKTNLMIFITPYIIKNETEAGELTRHKGEVLDDFRKEYRIEKKIGGPNLQPARPAGKNGTGEKPAGESLQPQTEVKPATEQPLASSITSTATPPPVVEKAPAQPLESSVTPTTSPVVKPATEQPQDSSVTAPPPPVVEKAPVQPFESSVTPTTSSVVKPAIEQQPESFSTSTLPPVKIVTPKEDGR